MGGGGPWTPPTVYGEGGTPQEPNIGNALSWAAAKFQAVPLPLIVATLVPVVLYFLMVFIGNVVTSGMGDPFNPPSTTTVLIVSGLFGLVGQVLMAVAAIPLMRMSLAITRGQAVDFSMMTDMTNVGPAVITSLIFGLIVGLGWMLCFVPGVVAAVLLWPARFVALEKGNSPMEALSEGFGLGSNGSMALGNFVAGLIAFVGILLCCVGIFATYPLAMLASAHLYRSALGEPVAA